MRIPGLGGMVLGGAAALMVALGAGGAAAQSPTVGSQAQTGTAPSVAAPKTAPAAAPKAAAPDKAAKAEPLDINTASMEQLDALKGVGAKRAADIVKGRPYKGKDELYQKKILPKAVYDGIKDKIIAKQK